jgi:hypothetical protein
VKKRKVWSISRAKPAVQNREIASDNPAGTRNHGFHSAAAKSLAISRFLQHLSMKIVLIHIA